jgi:hypothetical protein
LDVYVRLAELDKSPSWQLPVWYQVGMSYERLEQPVKAVETYGAILGREKEIGTNLPPSLRAVLDMARWRRDFLNWQGQAEADARQFKSFFPAPAGTNAATAVGAPAPGVLAAADTDDSASRRALRSDPVHLRPPESTAGPPTPQLE